MLSGHNPKMRDEVIKSYRGFTFSITFFNAGKDNCFGTLIRINLPLMPDQAENEIPFYSNLNIYCQLQTFSKSGDHGENLGVN